MNESESRARAQDARIASLERQLTELRPLAEIAAQLRKALVALLARGE